MGSIRGDHVTRKICCIALCSLLSTSALAEVIIKGPLGYARLSSNFSDRYNSVKARFEDSSGKAFYQSFSVNGCDEGVTNGLYNMLSLNGSFDFYAGYCIERIGTPYYYIGHQLSFNFSSSSNNFQEALSGTGPRNYRVDPTTDFAEVRLSFIRAGDKVAYNEQDGRFAVTEILFDPLPINSAGGLGLLALSSVVLSLRGRLRGGLPSAGRRSDDGRGQPGADRDAGEGGAGVVELR